MRQQVGRRVLVVLLATIGVLLGSHSFDQLGVHVHLHAQAPETPHAIAERIAGPIVIDPAGAFQGESYIGAPLASLGELAPAQSQFIVHYSANFPPAAQAAFQAAIDIWASQIQSTVPIQVTANWSVLSGTTLGSAGPRSIFRNFNAASAGTWYPVALANKLYGADLEPGVDDITANFASNYDCSVKPSPCWYYGTDSNGGAGYYDFMTVVLHELGHGLGFLGSMNEDTATRTGRWGSNGFPYVYDRFAVNGSGQSLIDTSLFANPSTALGTQLTGNDIFLNGANARAGNSGSNARLYAPALWASGSSYSHLSEATYPTGNMNSLMTPFIGAGEVVHDPGPIVRGAFMDMGWGVSTASAPTLTSISPATGTTAGSALLTLTGSGFLSGATVKLGGTTASSVVQSDRTITVTAPAHAAGAVSVVVTNPDQQAATLTNGFTYVVPGPTPAVTAIAPAAGPHTGGTFVSISGAGFVNGAIVQLGGNTATGVVVQSATSIVATTPAHGPALVSVVVTNPDGQRATLSNAFDYLGPLPLDFDEDRRSDVTVFRPDGGQWFMRYSGQNYSTSTRGAYQWGQAGDVPLSADFDGDGAIELTVWRPSTGTWYIRYSSRGYSAAAGDYQAIQWGLATDMPMVGDFDGDGKADLTLYRASEGMWYILYSSLNYATASSGAYQWGLPGDIPVAGDFDGDGKTDLTVWRPSTGVWNIRYSSQNYSDTTFDAFQWGAPDDIPIVADFDGDGKTEIAVYRPVNGMWYVRYSSLNYTTAAYGAYQWGVSTDLPIAADFDGDGRTDIAVYRPPTGVWYIRYSAQNYSMATFGSFQWGAPGDVPVR